MVARTYTSDTDQLASLLSSAFDRIASLERSVGWRPGGTSYVLNPAYAGQRPVAPTDAWHSRVDGSVVNASGYAQRPGLVFVQVDSPTPFSVYQSTAPGSQSSNRLANFDYPRSVINGIQIGAFVGHAQAPCIWLEGRNGDGDYVLLVHPSICALNGSPATNNSVGLRVQNVSKIECNASGSSYVNGTHVFSGGPLQGHYQTANSTWDQWPVVAWGANGYSSFSGVHADGTAAAGWRIYPGQGEAMYAVNWNNTLHTPAGGLRWDNMSSATIKRDIRPLRPEREHVVVRPLTPGADLVEQPDIMGLCPTVFRHKGKVQRPIRPPGREHDDDVPASEYLYEDYPDDNWIQRVRTREVLGLIAEEVQHVVPSAVTHDESGAPIAIDYSQITVALLDHVQELTRTVETLRYRITELENRP